MLEATKNSINLYRGNSPKMIKMALMMQSYDVVNELKEMFHENDLDKLAEILSRN